jgi:hypothetical protein
MSIFQFSLHKFDIYAGLMENVNPLIFTPNRAAAGPKIRPETSRGG